MLLDTCCLIPNARLVRLRSDDLEQVEGIVNASSRETLDFLGCITALAGALRGRCGKSCVGELAPCSDGTRSRRLGLSFLSACLRCGLLRAQSRLLLCKQPRVLRFTRELCLALLLLIFLAFASFGAVGPLVCFRAFLYDWI